MRAHCSCVQVRYILQKLRLTACTMLNTMRPGARGCRVWRIGCRSSIAGTLYLGGCKGVSPEINLVDVVAAQKSPSGTVRRAIFCDESGIASGRTSATIDVYSTWTRRFVDYCLGEGLDPIAHLTLKFAERFRADGCPRRKFRRRRRLKPVVRLAIVGPRALSCALGALGHTVPQWRPRPAPPPVSPVVHAFVAYRVKHRGIATTTIRSDVAVATKFLCFLRVHRRSPVSMRVTEIDRFILDLASKCARKTVAGNCSTLRAFLRFLHLSGRAGADKAVAGASSPDATRHRVPCARGLRPRTPAQGEAEPPLARFTPKSPGAEQPASPSLWAVVCGAEARGRLGAGPGDLPGNASKSPRRTKRRRPGRMLGRRPVRIQKRTVLTETRAMLANSSRRRRSPSVVIDRQQPSDLLLGGHCIIGGPQSM